MSQIYHTMIILQSNTVFASWAVFSLKHFYIFTSKFFLSLDSRHLSQFFYICKQYFLIPKFGKSSCLTPFSIMYNASHHFPFTLWFSSPWADSLVQSGFHPRTCRSRFYWKPTLYLDTPSKSIYMLHTTFHILSVFDEKYIFIVMSIEETDNYIATMLGYC